MLKKGLFNSDLKHQTFVIGFIYAALAIFGIFYGTVLIQYSVEETFTASSVAPWDLDESKLATEEYLSSVLDEVKAHDLNHKVQLNSSNIDERLLGDLSNIEEDAETIHVDDQPNLVSNGDKDILENNSNTSISNQSNTNSSRISVSDLNNNISTNKTDLNTALTSVPDVQENTLNNVENKVENEIDSSMEDYDYDISSLKGNDYDDDLDDSLNSVNDNLNAVDDSQNPVNDSQNPGNGSQNTASNSLNSNNDSQEIDNDFDSIDDSQNSINNIKSDSLDSDDDIQLEFNDNIPSIIDAENRANDDTIKLNDTDPIESSTANNGPQVPNHVKHLDYMIDGEGLEAIFASVVRLACSTVLILGVKSGRHWFLVPWIVVESIEMAAFLFKLIVKISVHGSWSLMGILMLILLYVLGGYFLYSVISFHHLLRRMSKQSKEVITSLSHGGYQSDMNYRKLQDDTWVIDPPLAVEFRDRDSGFTREKVATEENDDYVLYVKS